MYSPSPLPLATSCCTILLATALGIAGIQAAELPPDNEYVIVKDGHLSVNSEREPYWSVIGKTFIDAGVKPTDSLEEKKAKLEQSRRGTDVLVQRFVDLGFNAVRLWDVVPGTDDYEVGDGSRADCLDYFLSQIKQRGFRVWNARQYPEIMIVDRAGRTRPFGPFCRTRGPACAARATSRRVANLPCAASQSHICRSALAYSVFPFGSF